MESMLYDKDVALNILDRVFINDDRKHLLMLTVTLYND